MKKEINPVMAGVIIAAIIIVVVVGLIVSGRQQQAVIPQGLHVSKRSLSAMPPPPKGMLYTHGPVTGSGKKFSPEFLGIQRSKMLVPQNPYTSGNPQIPAPQ